MFVLHTLGYIQTYNLIKIYLEFERVFVTTVKSLSIREWIEYGQEKLHTTRHSFALIRDVALVIDKFVGRMSANGTR